MSSRLPDSKRNELIAEYNEGKTNPDYEVIPSKTQKGKYTVRKRKVSLPVTEDTVDEYADIPDDNTAEEPTENDEEPEMMQNYNPSYYMPRANNFFEQYQFQMNQMFLEQMKLMRQNIKWNKRKQDKIKGKTQKIYDIISEAVSRQEPEPEPEQKPPELDPIPEEPGPQDYFEKNYKAPEQVPEQVPESEPEHVPEEDTPQYEQPYEREIDEMSGFYFKPYSRKDRINWKNFNI